MLREVKGVDGLPFWRKKRTMKHAVVNIFKHRSENPVRHIRFNVAGYSLFS